VIGCLVALVLLVCLFIFFFYGRSLRKGADGPDQKGAGKFERQEDSVTAGAHPGASVEMQGTGGEAATGTDDPMEAV